MAALAVAAVSLACSFAVPFSASGTIGSPTPQAPQGLIAYVGNDGNIYTTDRNGKQQHVITRDAALNPLAGQAGRYYQYLTWAPDGQHLAYVEVSTSQSGQQEVSLLSALSDGKKPVDNFTSQSFQPFYLYWSPNSQTIAFLGSDATTGALSQYLVAAAGGKSKLVGGGQPYYWDWSPDNRSMIVHTGGDSSDNPDARLAFVGVDGSVPNKNLDVKPGLFDAPAWSPAGDGVALATQNDAGDGQLILVGRDGKVKQVLASLSGPVTFAWSPKGIHLAYAMYDPTGSAPTIRLVVLDSAHPDHPNQVTQGDVVAFFWSPDGRKIAYFVPGSEGPSASSVQTVAQTNASPDLGVWVYDRVSGTTKEVATFTPTDSFQQIFPFYSQYQRSDTIWSPDSQELVLSGVDSGGGNAIYTVGADGSHFQKIADGDLAFWSWK
jgi:Tol biopolymer transport system component